MDAAAGQALHCVLLPCRSGETWVVPLNSIAEVLAAGELHAGRLAWRGCELPVYPPVEPGSGHLRGIFAVIRGLQALAGGHWAVSLRDHGLAYRVLTAADFAEPTAGDHGGAAVTLAAFRLGGDSCVVPDLGALQTTLAAESAHGPCKNLSKWRHIRVGDPE